MLSIRIKHTVIRHNYEYCLRCLYDFTLARINVAAIESHRLVKPAVFKTNVYLRL